jgi:hypothetical protein
VGKGNVWGSQIMNVLKVDPTPTPTPSVTPTSTVTPTPTITPTTTVTPTLTVTPTPSVTPTLTPTTTVTPTSTLTPTVTPTNTPTPSSSPIPSGTTEANAYLSAVVDAGGTGITPTISAATVTLFTSLVSNGLWDELEAFYPYIGGIDASHKFNAKNPVDTDAAYRLIFNGGWTHDANGITPNGINADADTFYVPSSAATLTSASIGFYYSNTASTRPYPVEMGVAWFNTGIALQARMPSATQNIGRLWGGWSITNYGDSAQTGTLIISRTSSSLLKLYRRGVLNYTNTGSPGTNTNLTLGVILGGLKRVQIPDIIDRSDRNQRFTFIAKGLDDTQVANLDTIIQDYQTALGRNAY